MKKRASEQTNGKMALFCQNALCVALCRWTGINVGLCWELAGEAGPIEPLRIGPALNGTRLRVFIHLVIQSDEVDRNSAIG